MRYFVLIFIFATAVFTTGCYERVDDYAKVIKVTDLVGNWNVGGAIAKVEEATPPDLAFTTETGLVGTGKINGDRIEVPSWKVTGRLAENRQKIYWSNKIVWSK